jgi:xylan 1,4-beta-xylosidase
VFLLRGMRSAAGRVDALAYWVASDHFEELGRPPRLLHGGFGLQTVGGLAKPRFHALSLLSRLGPVELPVVLDGDGGGSLVEAWASRDRDRIAVLVWNLTLDQSKADGAAELTREITLSFPGVDPSWQATATWLTPGASSQAGAGQGTSPGSGDLVAEAAALDVGDWPTDNQWRLLAERNTLRSTPLERSTEEVTLTLQMPSAVLVELRPPS